MLLAGIVGIKGAGIFTQKCRSLELKNLGFIGEKTEVVMRNFSSQLTTK